MDNTTEVPAVVRSLDDGFVWLEVEQGGCGRCHEEGGCGGQQLTQALCGKPKTYRVVNGMDLKVGDRVALGISADLIRKSANLVYVLPLLGLLVGAIVGMRIAADPGAIAGGSLGLVAAWFFMRSRVRSNPDQSVLNPHIVSRI